MQLGAAVLAAAIIQASSTKSLDCMSRLQGMFEWPDLDATAPFNCCGPPVLFVPLAVMVLTVLAAVGNLRASLALSSRTRQIRDCHRQGVFHGREQRTTSVALQLPVDGLSHLVEVYYCVKLALYWHTDTGLFAVIPC